MLIPLDLKRLAELFPAPLYVVGGAVRDSIAGNPIHDYDLTSSMKADEVIRLLRDTEYKVTPHSLKLGTLGIKVGEETMEYTAFRKDSYAGDGSHSPCKVEFECSLEEDARRRDFTVNAVYYDILGGEYVDPLGGIQDIKKGILRTTRAPKEVIDEDALRMLRLVRFSASCGYEIEEETAKATVERAYSLNEIAVERIREEFNKILIADTVNGIKDAHTKGIRIMIDLGLMEYVVPEILEGIGVKQNARYHVYDVFNHILEAVRVAPPHLRLVAFLHDIGKPRSVGEDGHMHDHAPIGAGMTRIIMNRLLYPHREIEHAVRLVENHMFNIKCNLSEEVVRGFVLKNYNILPDLILLKEADHYAHGMDKGKSPSAKVIKEVWEDMLQKGVAFTIKDLPIDGKDLIDNNVEPCDRALVLNALLEHGAYLGRALTRDEALSFVRGH